MGKTFQQEIICKQAEEKIFEVASESFLSYFKSRGLVYKYDKWSLNACNAKEEEIKEGNPKKIIRLSCEDFSKEKMFRDNCGGDLIVRYEANVDTEKSEDDVKFRCYIDNWYLVDKEVSLDKIDKITAISATFGRVIGLYATINILTFEGILSW